MPQAADLKHFAQELTSLQRPLYVYITKLLGRPTDAEDVLQEVNRVLWEKVDEFQPGTNLAAWATRVAQFEVMTFRKKHARQRLCFNDALIEMLADEAATDLNVETDECTALHRCLEKLPERDRDLVTKRYIGEHDLRALAGQFNRSEPSLCRSLTRIRMSLLECIRNSLSAEAGS